MHSRILIAAAFAAVGLVLSASTPVTAQTVSLSAVLNGGNECNNAVPPDCRQGDLDGYGIAGITFPTSTRICVTIQVDNLAGATAAHIHRGAAGLNGPIVIALPPPNAPGGGNPGVSAFCAAAAAATLTTIRNFPGSFYLNVHNAAFPGGAIRGQLF